ncbi:TPA: acetyltransferase [Salmonella enterica subsp. enterica serovar Napoli]|nr:acetyltransferase [Salmonella enterica subsp. enterica serovar Napoli]
MRQEIIPGKLPTTLKTYLNIQKSNKKISIAPGVIIDESAGRVLIGEGTQVCHGVVIQGPVVIGSGCRIGNYSFIRPGTLIGNNVQTGFSTEIKNSVIESGTTIGPQCFISDSVLRQNVYLGAQVRTSNHRLDEGFVHVRLNGEDINTGCKKLGCYIGLRARIGVQVIILPGRYIVADTIIGPRVTIERNLEKGIYNLRQEIIRKEG